MKKISGKGVARARKGFTKLISDEDMNKIIKIKKSLEHSSVLLQYNWCNYWTSKTWTEKNKKVDFLELC